MAKPRVTMQPTRAKEVSTQAVQMLNPDAWREGLTTAQRGYGGKWQKARIGFLFKNPICETCKAKGVITEATVVDHVIPHRGNMALFWDTSNWSAKCKPCHSVKTALEEGGIGTARKG